MKLHVKKLLSILTALALLVGLVLPTGVLSALASDSDSVVTEIDFTNGNIYCVGGDTACVYRDTGDTDNPYVVTFEYFLPEIPYNLELRGGGETTSVLSGDNYFSVGYHTMEVAFAYNGSFVPRIYNPDKNVQKLYIWNFQVSQGEKKLTPVGDAYPYTTATVTTGSAVSEYSWYADRETDSPVTLYDFTDKAQFGIGKYTTSTSTTKYWQVSFEYFLPEATTSLSYSCATGTQPTILSGTKAMPTTKGHHKVNFTAYKSAPFYPRFNAALGTKLYVWNYSVKLVSGGVELPYAFESATGEVYAGFGDADKMLSEYDWAKYLDVPIVTEVSAPSSVTSGNYSWTPSDKNFYFNGIDEASAYTVSFDYYLPADASTLQVDSVSGYTNPISGGSLSKTAGHHTFSWTVYIDAAKVSNGQFVPRIVADYATKIYVWNWKVVQKNIVLAGENRSWAPASLTYGTLGTYLSDYDWAATMDDPFVTEILAPASVTSGTYSWSLPNGRFFYGGKSEDAAYTITFDYYLPQEVASLTFESVSGWMVTVAGSSEMAKTKGHHKLSWTTYVNPNNTSNVKNGQFVPCIKIPAGADLYLWNWSVKIGGVEQTASGTGWSPTTTGTVGDRLGKYEWAASMDDIIPVSMVVGTMPTKTLYMKGDPLDTTGLSLTVNCTYGVTKTVTEGYTVSGYNANALGAQTITVTYAGLTATFTVTVTEPIVTEIYAPLSVASGTYTWSLPNGRFYYGGKSEDTAYTITFDYYLPQEVSSLKFGSVSGWMAGETANENMATTVGHHTYTWTTYADPAGVANGQFVPCIKIPAGADLYLWNWSVKIGGVEQTATGTGWNPTTTGTVGTYLSTYDWYDTMDQLIPMSLTVNTNPNKTTYKRGEALDTTGLTLTLTYNDRSTETIIDGFEVSGFESETAGTKTLTVTYGELKTTFTVTVSDPIVTEIYAPLSVESGTYTWSLPNGRFYYGGKSAETAYTVTFDYYLPKTIASLSLDSASGWMSTAAGSNEMPTSKGHHTVSWTTYVNPNNTSNITNGQFVPKITLPAGADMYLWNWCVTQGGVELTATGTGWNPTTTGTVGTYLYTYDWYSTMDEKYVAATHFDFDGANFNSATFMKDEGFVNKSVFYATSVSSGAASGTFRLSFDYYLPEETPIYVNNANDTGKMVVDDATGISYLQQGYHTFSATFNIADYAGGSNTIFGFASPYDYWVDISDGNKDGIAPGGGTLLPKDLYVWNFRFENLTTGSVRATGFASGFAGAGADCMTTAELKLSDMKETTEVYELDFTTCPGYDSENFADGVYFTYMPFKYTIPTGESAAANEYTITFDYYMPESSAKMYAFFADDDRLNADGGHALRNLAEGENGDYPLEPGRHTFMTKVYGDEFLRGNPSLRFEAYATMYQKLSKLYVWNVKVVCTAGSASSKKMGNYLLGRPMMKTTASKVTLNTVAVPNTNLASAVELDMVGAQVREDHAMRFVVAIKGADITRLPDGNADYTEATITVGGVEYAVTGAGVLFGRDLRVADIGKAVDDALRIENIGSAVYNIPAKKLQHPVNAARYLGGESGVVFTGVIPNVPRANWEDSLSARAYVKVVDAEGNASVIYGDVISRSLTQLKNVTFSETKISTPEAEAQANALRGGITGAANTTFTTNVSKTYYVDSVNGNDANNGTSESSAWKTLTNVNALSNGTSSRRVVVLFKRGGEYRGQLKAKNYTSYGAYGVGEKPLINGSQQDYSKLPIYASVAAAKAAGGLGWVKMDAVFGNRWQLVGMGDYLTALDSSDEMAGNNVGNMLFFKDGNMTNGSKSMNKSIYKDYQFYHQVDRTFDESTKQITSITLGDLYVFLPDDMTPADFDKIEIGTKMSAIVGAESKSQYINIDNLKVMYTGCHGISMSGKTSSYTTSNVSVTNCEIGWIGGSIMRYTEGTSSDYTDDVDVRLGNGIEFYGACSNITVKNNWIYQCFDAGYSNQGGAQIAQEIEVSGNLIEYCAYSIEIWMSSSEGLMKNCAYKNNMMRFAGYEFERDNRIGGSLAAISHVNFMFRAQPCENVTVTGNTFDSSYSSILVAAYPNSETKNTANDSVSVFNTYKNDVVGPQVSGNTWILGYDRYSAVALSRDLAAGLNCTYHGTSQAEMEQSVAKVDTAPVDVIFYK